MAAPSRLTASLFALMPALACAQPAPSPVAWRNSNGSPAESAAEIRAVVSRLVAASHYPLKARVRVYCYDVDAAGRPGDSQPLVARRSELASTPAGALAPRQGLNATDDPVIWVNEKIRSYARNRDEAAFIVAHELAHLAFGHHAAYEAAYCAEMNARLQAGKSPRTCATRTADDENALWDEGGPPRARLEALSRAQEIEADFRGAEIAERAGFAPSAAFDALDALAERYRANGWKGDGMHPLPAERIEKLRRARGG